MSPFVPPAKPITCRKCLGCGHMIRADDGILHDCPGLIFRECLIKLAKAIREYVPRFSDLENEAEEVLKMLEEQAK